MKIRRLSIIVVCIVLLGSLLAYGQTWDEEDRANAKSILEEKFALQESLSFNQEGGLNTERFQAFPAAVSITDEKLDEGLTLALMQYGEETFLLCFVASIPETEPPYGFGLINDDGEVVSFDPAEIEGTEEGPETPGIELLEEREESYRLALKFREATISVELPKEIS